MALPMNNPDILRTVLEQSPYGAFSVSSSDRQYHPYNLPDRLRGLGIEHALKTVTVDIGDHLYDQFKDDSVFRDQIKINLSRMISEEVVKVTKFTQIKDPSTFNTKVIGRVVIMTEDQLKKLIAACR